jgi:putative transposase
VVWNNLLDWRNKEYSLNGNKINYTKSSAHLTELKNQEQFSWLNEVSSVALQPTLHSQDATFSNFFAKRAKYPNFKRKSSNQSFRLMSTAYRLKDGQLYIAKSTEPLNVIWSRPLEGKHSSVTIAKDCADRYFISLHNKISDSRKYFLHKLSTKLINENQVISLEDLNAVCLVSLVTAISNAYTPIRV